MDIQFKKESLFDRFNLSTTLSKSELLRLFQTRPDLRKELPVFMYVYNGLSGVVATEKVTPVDTTGAGDAFFGTVLAELDGKEFTKENIENALIKGNKAGAKATQFKGAIKL